MTGHDRTTPERHELSPDELNDVSGGVVCITAVPPGPSGFGIGIAGCSGAGKVHISVLSISKTMDKSSPLF